MGWAKKKLLKELLNISTGNKIGSGSNDYRKLASDFFGIKEEDVTIRMVMDFRQIEKAILKGDTQAYNAIMDRSYGKPVQAIAQTDSEGNDIDADLSKLSDDDLRRIIKTCSEDTGKA